MRISVSVIKSSSVILQIEERCWWIASDYEKFLSFICFYFSTWVIWKSDFYILKTYFLKIKANSDQTSKIACNRAEVCTIIIIDKIIIVRQGKKMFPTCKALVTLTNKSVWSNIDAVTIETCRWLALSNYFCTIFTCVKE